MLANKRLMASPRSDCFEMDNILPAQAMPFGSSVSFCITEPGLSARLDLARSGIEKASPRLEGVTLMGADAASARCGEQAEPSRRLHHLTLRK
jgi:hypothetical protein